MLCDVGSTFPLMTVPVNTLDEMAADKSSSQRPDREAGEADGHHAEKAPAAEAFGVVEVARHAKDDGRALLIYTRVDGGSA